MALEMREVEAWSCEASKRSEERAGHRSRRCLGGRMKSSATNRRCKFAACSLKQCRVIAGQNGCVTGCRLH